VVSIKNKRFVPTSSSLPVSGYDGVQYAVIVCMLGCKHYVFSWVKICLTDSDNHLQRHSLEFESRVAEGEVKDSSVYGFFDLAHCE